MIQWIHTFIGKFEWFRLYLVGDVFFSVYMLDITSILMFLINLQEETWKGRAAYISILSKIIVFILNVP
jgi:hypothetical protein